MQADKFLAEQNINDGRNIYVDPSPHVTLISIHYNAKIKVVPIKH